MFDNTQQHCFAVTVIQSATNSYQSILESNVRPCSTAKALSKLDKDLKHTSKYTKAAEKEKIQGVALAQSKSRYLNLIEILALNLCKRMLTNPNEMK